MSVECKPYLSEKEPERYKETGKEFTITNSNGIAVSVITYGALVNKLIVPDKEGKKADIMLGLKGLDEYMNNGANHGSIVGRSANRIHGATYEINGERFYAPKNNGEDNLHGGSPSYQNVFWEGKIISGQEADLFAKESGIKGLPEIKDEAVMLTYTSPDGACGFPGNLDTTVVYALTDDDMLLILYKGISDRDTIFAPTNHSYFNLGGHNSGEVLDNVLTVDADQVIHKDSNGCPDGEYIDVEGTVFDFRAGKKVGDGFDMDNDQIGPALGLDQNFCLNGYGDGFFNGALLEDHRSSRKMEVWTDMPGIQLYVGNHLNGDDQKGDIQYKPYYGICLEAQMYPNAVNIPQFESPVIKAGEAKYHACGYKFV
ncbi:MAG: galactose mutarotase [Clostridiales bacterium]|nr:galactose mutarotase [Clostridiales bacterium]